jgi:inorganic pyrophosphatase
VANIRMFDDGVLDDKIVAVSTTDPFYRHIKSFEDIPKSMVDELTYFYNNYKRPENKETKVEKWCDVDEAKELIEGCQKRFWENYAKLKS